MRRPRRLWMVVGMASSTINQTASAPADMRVRVRLSRDDVMTATEVADLLALPVSTVYHLARTGQIPASRLGRTWRFLRPRIEDVLNA